MTFYLHSMQTYHTMLQYIHTTFTAIQVTIQISSQKSLATYRVSHLNKGHILRSKMKEGFVY